MKKKIRNGIALLCAMLFLQFYLPVAACNTAYAEKKTNEPVLELDESYEIESNTASASNSKKKEYTVAVKKSIKLSVSTKKTVKWSSSNKKIATVSSNGVVKGKKAGTVTITAKYGSKKKKFTVIVTSTKQEPKEPESSKDSEFSNHFALQSMNIGPLKKMTGSLYFILVLVSTPNHPWTQGDMDNLTTYTYKSIDNLKQEAARYHVNLNLKFGYLDYTVSDAELDHGDWIGIIIRDYFKANTLAEVCSAYQSSLHVNSTPILFMLNKEGRSYSAPTSRNNAGWQNEYEVIYCKSNLGDAYLTHETAHLYGAIDYYDYNNEGVAEIARKYFPDSCMLIGGPTVDSLTAYLVGWTDTISSEARNFLTETQGLRKE